MITPSFSLTATERVLPAMALDFTTASLDGRVTFTRALATATRTNSSGLIEAVAADTARFDYDPVTLACKGLLIEESRANILLQSVFAGGGAAPTSFTQPSATGTSAPATSTRTTTGSAYLQTATAERPYLAQSVAVTASTVYTLSMVIESTTGVANNLILGGSGVTITQYYANGVAVAAGDASVVGILSAVFTAASSISYSFRFGLGISQAVTGSLQFSCPQLEAGAFPTSYIPTTTVALTRNADVATMTGTNFSDWFNASEGTFSVTATVPAITGLNMRFISANDGTSSNRIDLYGITDTQLRVVNSGSVQASVTSGTIASYQERTSVGAYKADSFATATNADSVSTDTSGTVPTVDQLYIGRATVSNATYCNGTIKQINYWQQRLTDNEVVAFSKGL